MAWYKPCWSERISGRLRFAGEGQSARVVADWPFHSTCARCHRRNSDVGLYDRRQPYRNRAGNLAFCLFPTILDFYENVPHRMYGFIKKKTTFARNREHFPRHEDFCTMVRHSDHMVKRLVQVLQDDKASWCGINRAYWRNVNEEDENLQSSPSPCWQLWLYFYLSFCQPLILEPDKT